MRSLLPGILWIHWRSIAHTRTCTQAQTSPSCRFWLSSVHFHPTTPSFPPSVLSSPPLASLLAHLATFKVGDSSKCSKIFFFLFFGQPESIRNRGPRLITAVNQKPAPTSLPWSEKSVTAALWKVQRPVWRYIVLSTLEQAKKKKKKKGGLKFTPCQLHFLKLGVTYL